MLARVQQLIVLALVAAAVAVVVGAARIEHWWPAAGFVLVVIGGYAGVLAVEFWLSRRSYAPADAEKPSGAQLLRAWLGEVLAAPRVFLWQQPFRSTSEPDHLPNATGRLGVVFVHGFFCNRGLWNPWLPRLRAAGVPFAAVTLEPIFGSIDDYGPTIASAVGAVEQATGRAPLVIGHSMGGLAARAWLAKDARARVHRLITVASPHSGTRLASTGRGRNVAQMQHGSDWLAALTRLESTPPRTPTTCFWSHCDNIVFPTRSATLPGADNRHLPGTPHVAMAFHPAVIEEVLRATGAAPASTDR